MLTAPPFICPLFDFFLPPLQTEFDEPIEEPQNAAAAIDKEAGVEQHPEQHATIDEGDAEADTAELAGMTIDSAIEL